MFYGQRLQTFLQRSGETLYMPNLVFHTVWNISPTISVGNNPLYQSSFIEHIGSGGSGSDINRNLKKRIRNLNTTEISNVSDQINAGIRSHNILNYLSPKLRLSYDSFCKKL